MTKTIPRDPVICVSFINAQLRDFYPDLDELCHAFSADRKELEERLNQADYFYIQELNQFR